MRTPKALSLTRFYAALPTAEIERRLAQGGLTDLALVAARAELDARRDGQAPDVPAVRPATAPAWAQALAFGGVAVVVGGMLYLMAPKYVFLFATTVVIPIVAIAVGKAMPRLGLVLGIALVATPVWLWGLLSWSGALTFRQGDFKPIGALLGYLLLIVGSLLGVAWGGSLIQGARHQGTWQALRHELSEQRKRTIDAITRRR